MGIQQMLFGGGGGGAADVGDIANSLRFRNTAYLIKSVGTYSGNRGKGTFNFWVKLPVGTATDLGLAAAYVDASAYDGFRMSGGNQLNYVMVSSSTVYINLVSAPILRDPTGWYNINIQFDGAKASGSRWILTVNGTVYPFAGTDNIASMLWGAATATHQIGRYINGGATQDKYLARFCYVDGADLPATNFGYLNTTINEWVSKKQSEIKAVVDAGLAGSLMLDFDDATSLTTLGYDKSSKGNNWTLNNFSITAGETYDPMIDVPGNSFATLNPLRHRGANNYFDGNLRYGIVGTGGPNTVATTFGVSSGKWYVETIMTITTSNYLDFGATDATVAEASMNIYVSKGFCYYLSDGTKYIDGVKTAYGVGATINDVIGMAMDLDNSTAEFFKNGVSLGPAFAIPSGRTWQVALTNATTSGAQYGWLNFGQKTFAYAPPTGFKALCQANLPTPAILNPEAHFDVVLATGANIKTSSEAVFPSNFFEWIKDRLTANNHQLIDVVRGSSSVLQSNTTAAETTYTAPTTNSVGWVWKAGGAAVANNAGSIASQVSANVEAGFSIVTYTGNGVAGSTVGHGLSKAPGAIITKGRNYSGGNSNWFMGHNSNLWTKVQQFNDTGVALTGVTFWNDTAPDANVFSLGTNVNLNTDGNQYVAYCFTEVEGYSKIGSYLGNGSADGPFVHCGFRPKFVMVKSSTLSATNWGILDSERSPNNVMTAALFANSSGAESGANLAADFTATGFKLRTADTQSNGAQTYIFIAFADVPSKYSNAR